MPFYPPYADRDGDPAEKAQQEADHRRDVEQDREMMTEDPEAAARDSRMRLSRNRVQPRWR